MHEVELGERAARGQGARRALRREQRSRRRAQRPGEARLVLDQRFPGGFARGVRSRAAGQVSREQRGYVRGARILDQRERLAPRLRLAGRAAGRFQPGVQVGEHGGRIGVARAGKR
jgi:hypothetical protein